MLRNSTLAPCAFRCDRRGATLTEVLMSLLIFSIGIVSVFTLFPISILQSIRATQLTNTRIQYDNVVQLISARPELLLGARYWEPNRNYLNGEVIVPPPVGGATWPQNNFYYRANGGGLSGPTEPSPWPAGGFPGNSENTFTWNFFQRAAFAIDPLGFLNVDFPQNRFGNHQGAPANLGLVRPDLATSLRIPEQKINALFSMPDSWTIAFEAVPSSVSNGPTQLTFPNEVDLSGITQNSYRVILTSEDGRRSISRNLGSPPVTGNVLNLAGDLPGDLNQVSELSTVRVEYFNRRYTWMLTVIRTPDGAPRAQCVLFFNRSFNPDDEYLYHYEIPPSSVERNVLQVSWTGSDPKPLIREGNFVFDSITARWYRMVNVSSTLTSPATIVLERDLEGVHAGGDPTDDSNPATFGGMMFMPGIVHVYDLPL